MTEGYEDYFTNSHEPNFPNDPKDSVVNPHVDLSSYCACRYRRDIILDKSGLPVGQLKQSSPDLQNIPYKTKNAVAKPGELPSLEENSQRETNNVVITNDDDKRDRYVADEILSGRCPFGMLDNNQPGVLGCCVLGVPGCGCADEYMLNPHLTHLNNYPGDNEMLSSDDNAPHVDTPDVPTYKTKNAVSPSFVDTTGKQLPLSEPLYKCRIGWVYNITRTTSKRTGLPLRKKPSYRYEKTISGNEAWQLGRYDDDSNIPLENFLLFSPKRTRDLVVFIPNELWSQYPNQQSWTKPHGPTLFDNFPTIPNVMSTETEGTNWNAVLEPQPHKQRDYVYTNPVTEYVSAVYPDDLSTTQSDLLNTKPGNTKSVNNDINNLHVDTTGKISIWQDFVKRFINWLNA